MGISNFELRRQVFHIFLGISLVALLMFGFINKELILLAIIIGLVLSYLSRKIRVPVIYELLERFERQEDIKKFPGKGMIFYFIGVYITLLIFPKDIAMASIMVLALGDSVSHLYGLHYGKIRYPLSKTKFLEGAVAGLIAGFLGALVILSWHRWHEAFFASLAAMAIEAVDVKVGAEQVDDNLIVPIVAGVVIWLIRLF